MNSAVIIVIICLFFLNQSAFSQEQESFTIKRFTCTNRLPQNSIRSIVMDDDRFLWMTTEAGLVRFDGRYFKVFNQSNHPEINNDRFRGIMKTMYGHLLVSELTGTTFELYNGKVKLVKKGNPQRSAEMLIKGIVPDVEFYLQALEKKYQGVSNDELKYFPLNILPLNDNQYGVFLNKALKFRILKDKKAIKDIPVNLPPSLNFFSIGKNVYCFDNNKSLYYLDGKNGLFVEVSISGDLSKEKMQSFSINKNIIWNPAALKLERPLTKSFQGKDN